MINLRNLKSIKEKNADDGLQYVVDYILNKIQRDKSEFGRYSNDDDWVELDHYLQSIGEAKRKQSFRKLRKLFNDNNEDGLYINDGSFEKTLLRHLSKA